MMRQYRVDQPSFTISLVAHTMVLFFQMVTLNVAVNSYSNALLTLLISNQFVEIKGSVFKKFEKENLFQLSCSGTSTKGLKNSLKEKALPCSHQVIISLLIRYRREISAFSVRHHHHDSKFGRVVGRATFSFFSVPTVVRPSVLVHDGSSTTFNAMHPRTWVRNPC